MLAGSSSRADAACAICDDPTPRSSLTCAACGVTVCAPCYAPGARSLTWQCKPCAAGIVSPACRLCKRVGGALLPVDDAAMGFVHVRCAGMIPGPTLVPALGVVRDLGRVSKAVRALTCDVCGGVGAAAQCGWSSCIAAFHPSCIAPAAGREGDETPAAGLCLAKGGLRWLAFCHAHRAFLTDGLASQSTAVLAARGRARASAEGGELRGAGALDEAAHESFMEDGEGDDSVVEVSDADESALGDAGGAAAAGHRKGDAGGLHSLPRLWRRQPWGAVVDSVVSDAWVEGCASAETELFVTAADLAATPSLSFVQQEAFQRAVVAPFFKPLTLADFNTLSLFLEGGAGEERSALLRSSPPTLSDTSSKAAAQLAESIYSQSTHKYLDCVPLLAPPPPAPGAPPRKTVAIVPEDFLLIPPEPSSDDAAQTRRGLWGCGSATAVVDFRGGDLLAWHRATDEENLAHFLHARGTAEVAGLRLGGKSLFSLDDIIRESHARASTASTSSLLDRFGSLIASVPSQEFELSVAQDDVTPHLVGVREQIREQESATRLRIFQLLARVQLGSAASANAQAASGLLLDNSLARVLGGVVPLPNFEHEGTAQQAAPQGGNPSGAGSSLPASRRVLRKAPVLNVEPWQGPVMRLKRPPPDVLSRKRTQRTRENDERGIRVESVLHATTLVSNIWGSVTARLERGIRDHNVSQFRAATRVQAKSWTIAVEGRPSVDDGGADDYACAVCLDPTPFNEEPLAKCVGCGMQVHRKCYGLTTLDDEYACDACAFMRMSIINGDAAPVEPSCALCGLRGGTLKRTTQGTFAHLAPCALWTEGVFISDFDTMGPIELDPNASDRLRAFRVSDAEDLRHLLAFDASDEAAAHAAMSALPRAERSPELRDELALAQARFLSMQSPQPSLPLAAFPNLHGASSYSSSAAVSALQRSPASAAAPTRDECAICRRSSGALFACNGAACPCTVHVACAWLAGWYMRVTVPGSVLDEHFTPHHRDADCSPSSSFLYAGGGRGLRFRLCCEACASPDRRAFAASQRTLRAHFFNFSRNAEALSQLTFDPSEKTAARRGIRGRLVGVRSRPDAPESEKAGAGGAAGGAAARFTKSGLKLRVRVTHDGDLLIYQLLA